MRGVDVAVAVRGDAHRREVRARRVERVRGLEPDRRARPVDAVGGLGERAGAVEVPLDADDRAAARGRVGFHRRA